MTHDNTYMTIYRRRPIRVVALFANNVGGVFRNSKGFTLIELLIVISIIAILATLALPGINSYKEKAKSTRAINELRLLGTEITGYILDKQSPPDTLADINRANFKDPWKQPYVYAVPTLEDNYFIKYNSDYDLYSTGKDGHTAAAWADPTSKDDIIRFNNGAFFDMRAKP
jgi:prepilin-type N-terminal cleavage/methylation domain-containing protein